MRRDEEDAAVPREETAPAKARVGLVTTDPLRLVGLQTILADRTDLEVIPLSVPKALDTSRLETVVIDSGVTDHLFELLASFRRERPKLRLIVMGTVQEHEFIEQVIAAGAKGYLGQSTTEAELKLAIDVVRDGSVWAPRKVLARLLERAREDLSPKIDKPIKFTRREKEVLSLLALGHPNREIATALNVDEGAVKAHVGRLMRKMGVENRTALAMRTIELKDRERKR